MLGENLILTLTNALLAGLFAVMIWLLPGMRLLPKTINLRVTERIFLGTTFGFVCYVLLIFLIRFLGLPFWVAELPFFMLGFVEGGRWLKEWKPRTRSLAKAQVAFLILAIVGIVIQGQVLFRSGVWTAQGLQFGQLSLHDSTWHIFLIDELKQNFPPRHPGFAPVLVKNYHFLLDLTLASMARYLPLSTFELYYRLTPAAVSAFLSLSVFVVARRLSRSEWLANAAVILTLFAGNASWALQFFRGPEFHPSANTFMLDPIVDLMQNPHAVVVFPLMLAGLLGLMILEKKRNMVILMLTAITFGVIIGFKAWGGIIMLLALPIAALWMSLKNKRHDLWGVWFLAGFVSAVIFIPVYDAKTAAGLVWVPGWLLKRMVEDPDRYNVPRYFLLEQHYQATHNVLRLAIVNFKQMLIFLFGNLWVKTLGLVYVIVIVKRPSLAGIFMLTVTTASLSLPLLFNQGRMSYDIIQFGPYSLVMLSIFTVLILKQILQATNGKLAIALSIILLVLSVPSNATSIVDRFNDQPFLVPRLTLEAFDYLKKETPPESIILLYPSKINLSSALVAALSERPTYFSANTFSRITGEDYEGREAELRSFFRNSDPGLRNRIVDTNSIDYLLLTQEENRAFNPNGLTLTKVFENESIIISKINE
ncbi:MAG: hypothetical protein A2900_03160 [Candidatus Chisholmbacteria bacterium RIFCSPLOWO2_01_FULL_50_28]|uniref:Glycosyltransferase RgtA/B/C/D-like domain-containing protein n=1 Tax=Candidatus Chisholmbacteria bacterium RIFCSPHIGHO2_01_FULL_52_32 TaxID=1797591 RepID=A0A1G1VTA3_9BACT|nr:MAG: hypothetical protein A2786_03585 [Candidatus Chisholmbacteria bacterium RIFCSPHIGHO2_01_FULL_52_32]OGY20075.1 MAG: hypothetical protein A2900_03160 [Candidatus Chisholmbacteria bacterium RIFCSPLOWO2_01_FULL_50_28]